jgi:hypothetical protein
MPNHFVRRIRRRVDMYRASLRRLYRRVVRVARRRVDPYRLIVFAVAAASLYLWFAHPQVMAALLLAFLVFGCFTVAVAAMLAHRPPRKYREETPAERTLRIVNESEPRFHWWT